MLWTKPPNGGLFFLAVVSLVFCSCAGPSISAEKKLNVLIAAHNYAAADSYLDSIKLTQFGKKNSVLFNLDKGAVEHYGGFYRHSDENFQAAEMRMEELYTKSATREAGMLLLNDNTVDYMGEPYERVLEHVLRSLNYALRGDSDDALVESRKVELFLDNLRETAGKSGIYRDDAFAQYLSSLYYTDEGMPDDARISRDAAKKAYAWYLTDYNTPMPKFHFPSSWDEKPHGELVFIHYNGVAPRKVSRTFQVAWGDAMLAVRQSQETQTSDPRVQNALRAGILGNAITVAYPAYVQDSYAIDSSEVDVDSDPAQETQIAEDVSAIAIKALRDRETLIKTRAIARATIKYILARTASDAEDKVLNREFGQDSPAATLLGFLGRGINNGLAAVTEIADTRCWSALPSQIRIARIKLSPGQHDVLIKFKNAAGTVVQTHLFKNVEIQEGKRTYLAYRTAQ
ncbi:MAG: hypothetical protein ACYCPQ_08840 [Elusimicrobiota bacterium]